MCHHVLTQGTWRAAETCLAAELTGLAVVGVAGTGGVGAGADADAPLVADREAFEGMYEATASCTFFACFATVLCWVAVPGLARATRACAWDTNGWGWASAWGYFPIAACLGTVLCRVAVPGWAWAPSPGARDAAPKCRVVAFLATKARRLSVEGCIHTPRSSAALLVHRVGVVALLSAVV